MLTRREHFRHGIFQAHLPWFLPLAKSKFAAYAHLVSMLVTQIDGLLHLAIRSSYLSLVG
jgi:hypothetical protein